MGAITSPASPDIINSIGSVATTGVGGGTIQDFDIIDSSTYVPYHNVGLPGRVIRFFHNTPVGNTSDNTVTVTLLKNGNPTSAVITYAALETGYKEVATNISFLKSDNLGVRLDASLSAPAGQFSSIWGVLVALQRVFE